MKKANVQVGHFYTAKVSEKITIVEILGVHTYGGWRAKNVYTGREVQIRGAQRLRVEYHKSDADRWVRGPRPSLEKLAELLYKRLIAPEKHLYEKTRDSIIRIYGYDLFRDAQNLAFTYVTRDNATVPNDGRAEVLDRQLALAADDRTPCVGCQRPCGTYFCVSCRGPGAPTRRLSKEQVIEAARSVEPSGIADVDRDDEPYEVS